MKLRKYADYIIYSKRWFSNKIVPRDISALHISDLMPVVWLMLCSGCWIPSWCSLIRYWVNRSGVQQLDAAVCLWHFPLTFSVTPPWNSSCMAHSPLLRAKLVPLRPIFRRKLFFIAPKTPQLLPVWPCPPRVRLQVVSPSFLLPVRGQLWGQACQEKQVTTWAAVLRHPAAPPPLFPPLNKARLYIILNVLAWLL